MAYPKYKLSQVLAYTGTSSKFTNAMEIDQVYRFTATSNCWVRVTVTGGTAAVTTADNHLYIAGQELFLSPHDATNGFVHVVSDGTSGRASLSLIEGA